MTMQTFECWDDEESAPDKPMKVDALTPSDAAEEFAEAEGDWEYEEAIDVAVRSPGGALQVFSVTRRVSFDVYPNRERTSSLVEESK